MIVLDRWADQSSEIKNKEAVSGDSDTASSAKFKSSLSICPKQKSRERIR